MLVYNVYAMYILSRVENWEYSQKWMKSNELSIIHKLLSILRPLEQIC